MHARRSGIATIVSILAAAGALAVASGAASCAQSGAGENQDFTDSGPVLDATTDTGTGGDSATNAEGSSCDADTMTNLFNCGSCGHKCGSGQTCSCGMCQNFCTGGKTACCGQCVDTTTDINNCGQCGNQCLPPAGGIGTSVCVASTCTFTCPTKGPEGGTILTCGADAGMPGCYDPTMSAGACGGCGKICSGATPSCVDSMCCGTGDLVCGGQCTGVQTDPHNCGACDAGCGAGDAGTCVAGKCVGYSTSNPTVPFIDACALPGATTVLQSQTSGWVSTNGYVMFPSSFTFNFYGAPATEFWLMNDGAMGIGPDMVGFPFQTPDSYPDCQNPDPTTAYPAAVAFGSQDLGTGPLGVCYGMTGGGGDGGAGDAGSAADGGTGDGGVAGNQFVVTWKQATLLTDPGASIDISIVLTQGTDTLDFQYRMAGAADGGLTPTLAGTQATVGIQQGNGSALHTATSCYAAFITSDPYDVRYTP